MKENKTIYYTKQYEIDNQMVTGIKNICVYRIDNNQPLMLGELKCLSDDDGRYFKTSVEEVQDYLDEHYKHYSEWEIQEL